MNFIQLALIFCHVLRFWDLMKKTIKLNRVYLSEILCSQYFQYIVIFMYCYEGS